MELPIVSPFVAQKHVPSGAAASAAGLRGQAAGAAGGRGTVALTVCATGAPRGAALLLRVLAHGAPGLVQVPVAPQRLRVGAPAADREHAGAC